MKSILLNNEMKSNYQIKRTIILQNLELETILERNEKPWDVDKISSARASCLIKMMTRTNMKIKEIIFIYFKESVFGFLSL